MEGKWNSQWKVEFSLSKKHQLSNVFWKKQNSYCSCCFLHCFTGTADYLGCLLAPSNPTAFYSVVFDCCHVICRFDIFLNSILYVCLYLTQQASLSTTLRRIGEAVLEPAAKSTVLQYKDPDLPLSCTEATGAFRSTPISRNPCPHIRMLSNLIILHTITQGKNTPFQYLWDFISKMHQSITSFISIS